MDLPWGFQVSGITSFGSSGPIQPVVSGVDLYGSGTVGAGETGGTPLPGGGYNQFNYSQGKNQLAQLVNQFNQTYAGKTTTTGVIPTLALPSSFSFPRSFNSQDLRVTKIFRLGSERLKLSVFGECFNIFNIANLGGYSYNLTDSGAGFGVPTVRTSNIFGSGGPRTFQFGSRFTF